MAQMPHLARGRSRGRPGRYQLLNDPEEGQHHRCVQSAHRQLGPCEVVPRARVPHEERTGFASLEARYLAPRARGSGASGGTDALLPGQDRLLDIRVLVRVILDRADSLDLGATGLDLGGSVLGRPSINYL